MFSPLVNVSIHQDINLTTVDIRTTIQKPRSRHCCIPFKNQDTQKFKSVKFLEKKKKHFRHENVGAFVVE